jgi:hypothetical protein
MRLLAAALAVVLVAAADRASSSFVIGTLRRDGLILPFGAFDGKHWSAPWPLPQFDRAIPINLISVPKDWWGKAGVRETWQAWIGGAAATLAVVQPDFAKVHCTRQIGLRTDYRAAEPPPPPDIQPYPKDGLAVSPPQPLAPITILESGATELLPVWPAMRDTFNRAERDTASRFNDPMSERTRERIDPQFEAAYAYGTDPRIYYFESSRTYRMIGNQDCTIAFGTGWIVKSGDTYKSFVAVVDLLPCTRYGATYMLPFGVMTLNGHTYWIAQFSGWDHERFAVIDIKPKEVEAVINVWGGGC